MEQTPAGRGPAVHTEPSADAKTGKDTEILLFQAGDFIMLYVVRHGTDERMFCKSAHRSY